ncbi:MAG TPA: metalloregulator ArsR/SmtB family transcription factor [Terriglobia bacterium]|nr:metalloregulator ArsR/SmtB family transcription factor [Terriglobia bacterium]
MDYHAELFNGLGDPTRLRLLNLLTQAKEICVCELVDALQVPQYNISRHLHVLLKTGMVQDHKRGKWVYYSVAKNLKLYQRTLLRAVSELRDEREDLRQDEARAGRRLKLRSGGVCCVGLVSKIGNSSQETAAQNVAAR